MAAQDEPDVTVFRGWKESGKYVWSPYVTKLEARFRFADVRYATDVGSIRAAPKGKVPYVECRNLSPVRGSSTVQEESSRPRTLLSDSALIIETLIKWGVLPDLNRDLEPSKRSHDMALRAQLEDKLYFYHTWERWTQNYYVMRDHVLWAIPYLVRVLIGLLIYRNTLATLHGQGTGRFTAEEIAAFRRDIWEGLSSLLITSRSSSSTNKKSNSGDGPFWILGGDYPTEADACLFGFIVSVLVCTAAPDSQEVVKSHPILLDYASRIHDRYFPDYEKWMA
ncbi:hypothetical protein F4677DRAFT_327867 [Hypoxylon crocopeplum]|nr:hypothetical protein F4677DRAFT_327867 [Hypoxylon crocopeplum]